MYARAERLGNCPKADEDETSSARILIDGGDGVGRVTKPGLSQKVGEAAINPVPKAMILKEAREAAGQYGYEGRLKITVSVPQGAEIAKPSIPGLGSRAVFLFWEPAELWSP